MLKPTNRKTIVAFQSNYIAFMIISSLVYFLMGVFFIVAYPLSKMLDCCLGTEHGTFFRRGQLKALIDIHGADNSDESHKNDTLTIDEVAIIKVGKSTLSEVVLSTALFPILFIFFSL